ncbi:MAG: hypothetical protein LBP51_01875 [Deferribacteraceae bacterium]|jgi:hypothetical protein|nr:hypothetical protein [Deferribacteraceae bacterium]
MFTQRFLFFIAFVFHLGLYSCQDSNDPSKDVVASAQKPIITTQPISAVYELTERAAPLTLTAAVSDGGALSYQWFENSSSNNAGGSPINGARSAIYIPPVDSLGVFYYYVVVTNTNHAAINDRTTAEASDVAVITVLSNDARTPVISLQPRSDVYNEGDAASALTVVAAVSDGGALSYQWFVNTINSYAGASTIGGATSASCALDIAPLTPDQPYYYFVVVTNTNPAAAGSKTAENASDIATITVLKNAETPSITLPADMSCNLWSSACDLIATANVSDGGSLAYQWYESPTGSYADAAAISGATSSTLSLFNRLLTPPPAATQIYYYYLEVTNTNPNVSGKQTAAISSDFAAVTVEIFTVSFYDADFKLLQTGSYNTQTVSPSTILSGTWYTAGGVLASDPHYLVADVNFYAANNVLEVADAADLAAIGTDAATLAGTYILTKDIDLTGSPILDAVKGFPPIGSNAANFTGVFNGNGHKISGLWIDNNSLYIGLFGYINNAKIANLTVEIAEGRKIKGGTQYTGGMVGFATGGASMITNSRVIGDVTGVRFVGGLAGSLDGGDLINCYTTGNITAVGLNDGSSYAGGLIGGCNPCTISNSYTTGNISGVDYVGGIVAQTFTNASAVINTYSTGDISGTNAVGGIIGQIYKGNINKSYAAGNIVGDNYVGGIVGRSIQYKAEKNAALNSSVTGNTNTDCIGDNGPNINNLALDALTCTTNTTQLSESNFMQKDAYTNPPLSWCFDGYTDACPWVMPADGGYPILYWQLLTP